MNSSIQNLPLRDEPARNKFIDSLFEAFDRPGQPGVAVGIYRGGRTVFAKGYGIADLEQNAPITPQTVFHIASVSKQFTTFAIALLAREGKVDLEEDIRRYLPYVPDFGHRITVNHLIHNVSGLRDQWSLFTLGGQEMDSRLRQQQVVNMVSRQRALNFEPDTEWWYSNTNFTLLAEIALAVSGKTLRAFCAERIFAPLEMSRTLFYDDVTEIVPGRAQSYMKREKGGWQRALLNLDNVGATSLFTTVEDFAHWAGNFSTPVVGDAALIEQICTMGKLRDGTPYNYGFGLWRATYAGHEAVEHSGGDAGFRTQFTYFPKEQFGLAIFANFPFEDFARHINAIVDVYLNDTGAQFKDHVPAALKLEPKLLDDLAGTYVDDYVALVTLECNGDGLVWKALGAEPKAVVFRVDGTFDLGDGLRPYMCYRVQHDVGGAIGFEDVTTSFGGFGRAVVRYRRIELVQPTALALAEFCGDYRSPELDITYTFSIDDGRLIARSLWSHKSIVFTPTLRDRFDGDQYVMGIVQFIRGSAGDATGFHVHAGRVRHVLFERVRD